MDIHEGIDAQAREPAHGQSGRAKGRGQSVTMQLAEVQAERDHLAQQLAEMEAKQRKVATILGLFVAAVELVVYFVVVGLDKATQLAPSSRL